MIHQLSERHRVDTQFSMKGFTPHLNERGWITTPLILGEHFGFGLFTTARIFRITRDKCDKPFLSGISSLGFLHSSFECGVSSFDVSADLLCFPEPDLYLIVGVE